MMQSTPLTTRIALVLGGALVGWFSRSWPRVLPTHDSVATVPARTAQHAVSPSVDSEPTASLLRIEARLTTLEDAIQRLTASSRRPVAKAPIEVPDQINSARIDELVATLHSLEQAAVEQREQSEKLLVELTGLGALRNQNAEVKWDAVHQLVDLWQRDEEAAQDEVRLLSDRDLVRHYGAPTILWSNERGLHWFYREGHDPRTDTYRTEVYFRLQNGYVTTMGVDLN